VADTWFCKRISVCEPGAAFTGCPKRNGYTAQYIAPLPLSLDVIVIDVLLAVRAWSVITGACSNSSNPTERMRIAELGLVVRPSQV
jgi:hypothetical protein